MGLVVACEPAYANPAAPERALQARRPLPSHLSLPRYHLLRILGPSGLRGVRQESNRVGQLREALLDLGRGHVPITAAVPPLTSTQVQLALRLLDEFVRDRKLTDDSLVRLYYEEEGGRLIAISISQVQLRPNASQLRVCHADCGLRDAA
jgi:hypothetical protein